MKKTQLFFGCVFSLILGISGIQAQNHQFNGKFSSQGEVNAAGVLTMELTQSGAKLEGVANYKAYDQQLDTGMLSVNGYVKDGVGYIRFRNQRGNAVADGSISFQSQDVMVFNQTTHSEILPKLTYLYPRGGNSEATVINTMSFAGDFSSQGDVKATGLLTMEITQSGLELSGTARYESYSDGSNTGLLSITGFVKGSRGHIELIDQRGNVVADANISKTDNNTISFAQTTNSRLLPHIAYVYRK